MTPTIESFCATPMARNYLAAVRRGDRFEAQRVAREALASGMDLPSLYITVFQPALYAVGQLWAAAELSVAQEHLATAITQGLMAQLAAPHFTAPTVSRIVVSTCVTGELHDLGIQMVTDCFELAGWEASYLGANMPAGDIIRHVTMLRADVLAISITIGQHVLHVRELITGVRASPVGATIKILVGGQPFNRAPEIARIIGADALALDAQQAVVWAKEALP